MCLTRFSCRFPACQGRAFSLFNQMKAIDDLVKSFPALDTSK